MKASLINILLKNKFNLSLQNKKQLFYQFWFPLYPEKFFKSEKYICLFALLFALTLIFKFFSVFVAQFGMKLGLDNLPMIIVGIYFGPVFGIANAVMSDFLGWLLFFSHYPFFWMITLQYAVIGFLAGCFSCRNHVFFKLTLKKQLLAKNFLLSLMWIIYLFSLVLFVDKKNNNIWWMLGCTLCSFVLWIIFEVFLWYWKIKNKKYYSVFLFISVCVFLITIIVSFVMGPIIFKEYLRLYSFNVGNGTNSDFDLYFFLLVMRIVKETIKIPILIFCISNILFSVQQFLKTRKGYEKFIFQI